MISWFEVSSMETVGHGNHDNALAFTNRECITGIPLQLMLSPPLPHTHTNFQIELNPLDIALETLGSKNREIQTLTSQYHSNKTLNINPLSICC